jgi:hypothetical protein
MPFTLQLADAKNDETIKNISSNCPNSAAFIALVNTAIRRLLKRGDWYGTTQVVEFCTRGCEITWPNWAGTIEGVRFQHDKPGHVFNNWYRFTGAHHVHSEWRSDVVLEDAGTAPCYNDITGTTGKQIRYNVVKLADIGKKITIYGKKYGGQPLQEQNPVTGQWIDGLTITAASPYGTDATLVTQIDSVTREATSGMAYLYSYDPTTTDVVDLAQYQPNETNPRYRRSCIHNAPHGRPDANGICWRRIEALIKLEFIPLVNDRDFLLIDDFDALAFMIQAIKAEQAQDNPTAEAFILKAIRELNFRDRDKFPDQTTPIQVVAMSGRRIRSLY